ncbi:hypothetical protein GPROT2_03599 [Gammaproteobacteria bacterium]|nr:hypothetical protein GPROT2_03599 [Gammaproteobacteria bacterium]
MTLVSADRSNGSAPLVGRWAAPVFFCFLDALVLLSLPGLAFWLAVAAPLVALLLLPWPPAGWKDGLVYWWRFEAPPSHRAFSHYAVADPRVDIERLRDRLGWLPRSGREQHAGWRNLLTHVERDPVVRLVRRRYGSARELVAFSVLVLLSLVFLSVLEGASQGVVSLAVAALAVQYVACAYIAQRRGVELVGSVLLQFATSTVQKTGAATGASK